MSEIILNLPSEKATSEFGKKISENLKIGDIIYLSGEMGSGKTTLARSIICLLYTSPSPRDLSTSRMPSSA